MNAVKVVYEATLEHDTIEDDYLRAVDAVYAKPHQFDRLLDQLRPRGGVLVLNAPSNSGRSMTAHALLAQLRTEQIITSARVLSFGGSREFPIDRLPHTEDQCFILELPSEDEGEDLRVSERFGGQLAVLSQVLARRNNRLIILTRPEQWRRIQRGAPAEAAPVWTPPLPGDIASQWLRAEAPGLPVNDWLGDSGIRSLLDKAAPTDVLDVVDSILTEHRTVETKRGLARRAGQEASEATSFAVQVEHVVAARRQWRRELLDWHKEQGRTGLERNFLLAASVLRGAPAAHVYVSAATLGERLGDDTINVTGQAAPGVVELVHSLKGELTPKDTIGFTRPGWDDAVVEYFWTDRPLSRTRFLQWLGDAPLNKSLRDALEEITESDLRALAQRITDFALRWAVRHQRPQPLGKLAEKWHANDQAAKEARTLWPVLIESLDAASVHPTSSPYIHPMLLRWAKSTSPAQQEAVVAICSRQFGRAHTSKAMTRLKHAAAAQDSGVIKALRGAVRNLWNDPSVRPALFDAIITWCAGTEGTVTAGQRAFSVIAISPSDLEPRLPVLLDSSSKFSIEKLAMGWGVLLEDAASTEPDIQTENILQFWLDAALSSEQTASQVTEILRLAVYAPDTQQAGQRRDQLRAGLIRWQDSTQPLERKQTLWTRISQAIDRDLEANARRSLASAVDQRDQAEPAGE